MPQILHLRLPFSIEEMDTAVKERARKNQGAARVEGVRHREERAKEGF